MIRFSWIGARAPGPAVAVGLWIARVPAGALAKESESRKVEDYGGEEGKEEEQQQQQQDGKQEEEEEDERKCPQGASAMVQYALPSHVPSS